MVTLVYNTTKTENSSATSPEHLALNSNSRGINENPAEHIQETVENTFNEIRLKLSSKLQSTLDLERTLNTFYTHIANLLNCSGFHYRNEIRALDIQIGSQSPHTANYTVTTGEEKLGELTFMRKTKFAEAELAVLEMLIGVLFYPLRNALKYREAIENSLHDALTGVGNRFAMDINFSREMKLAKRHRKALAILLIDVDHFKDVNDKHGHRMGDKVLKVIADLVRQTLRETDQVFRYGGEEFIAVLNETDIENAVLSAERIRQTIAEHPIETGNSKINVTVSVGVSALSSDDTNESLFERADKALYQAKGKGRNCVICAARDAKSHAQKTA